MKDWQSRHGLPTTGVVDSATWRTLLATGGTSPTSVAANPLTRYLGTVLRRGSHGTVVRALQARLGIVVDGSFGPQTQAAVNRFKRAHHLPADGVVGRRGLAGARGLSHAGRARAKTAAHVLRRPG